MHLLYKLTKYSCSFPCTSAWENPCYKNKLAPEKQVLFHFSLTLNEIYFNFSSLKKKKTEPCDMKMRRQDIFKANLQQ